MAVASTLNFSDSTPAAPAGRQNVHWQNDGGAPTCNESAYDPVMVGDGGTGGAAGNVPSPAAGDAAAGKFLKADGTWATVAGSVPIATTSAAGIVKPDGSSITVDGAGTISATATAPSIATTLAAGIVKPDGTSISVDGAGTIGVIAPVRLGFGVSKGAPATGAGPLLFALNAGALTKCRVVTKTSDASVDLSFQITKNGTAIFSAAPTVAHGTAAGTLSTFTGLTSVPLAVADGDVFALNILTGTASWSATIQCQ